ncbi:hypothetical protein AMECASPLE_027233 [Ameca splendens]|uniref:Uncharacterized protein n=1 Tax=Ameca splendens TaxID=208324 RepID=A0ABV0XI64_9TELE
MGWRRGEEQVVKKRMSCLMGCQECNSIIMKSDSGELDGWMDGRMAAKGGGELLQFSCLNILKATETGESSSFEDTDPRMCNISDNILGWRYLRENHSGYNKMEDQLMLTSDVFTSGLLVPPACT